MSETTLWLPPNVYAQLMFYAWKVDAEVGGMGILEFNWPNPNDIYVKEVFLVEQTVHGAECNLSSEGMFNKYAGFIQANDIERATHMQLWWHSHYTMAPGHSSTDFATMKDWDAEYLVSLIINRRGELKAKLMSKVPVMVIGDIEVKINWYDIPGFEDCEAEIKELVKKQEIVAYNYQQGNYAQQQWKQVSEGTPYQQGRWNQETGKWESNQQQFKSVHDMTDAEWEAEEEAEWKKYFDECEKHETTKVAPVQGKKRKKGNGKAVEPLGFPVAEMDAEEKAALKKGWTELYD